MMDQTNEFLQREYFHNTVLDYLIALSIIVLGSLFVRLIKQSLLTRLKAWTDTTTTNRDNFVVEGIERFGLPVLYFFIIYTGLNYLEFSTKAEKVVAVATSVVITFFVVRLVSSTVILLIKHHIRRQEHGDERINQLGGLIILVQAFIWIIGAVFLFDNLGYNVTTIIAGLGIGGIAVALAAQNILGDLFNYFVILFDKPFEVGDFIIVDDKMGSVEYIGVKTTRIRSLSGEQLVVGNANLTSSRIHNYKRQQRRRVVFSINVQYETPLAVLKKVPGMLRSIVESQPDVAIDRAHFTSYLDWGLQFEVVYYVLSSDYNKYADIQQQINFDIYEKLAALGVSFAYPTQRIIRSEQPADASGEPDNGRS